MKTTFVKDLPAKRAGQSIKLWKTEDGQHILTSAIPEAFDSGKPETFVFAADEEGNVLSYTDLPGSFQGAMDHERAINGFESGKRNRMTDGIPGLVDAFFAEEDDL